MVWFVSLGAPLTPGRTRGADEVGRSCGTHGGRRLERYALLATTPGSGPKTLQDIINYNTANPVEGLKFQQAGLLAAQAVDLSDPTTNPSYWPCVTSLVNAVGAGSASAISLGTVPPTWRCRRPRERRLVGSLRLDRRSLISRPPGKVLESVTRDRGDLFLAVRNTGNTIPPIGGSVRVSGGTGSASRTLKSAPIVPGATVNLAACALHGSLPAGPYTLAATLG